jgi:hypothetical protein
MKEWERRMDKELEKYLKQYANLMVELPINWTAIGANLMRDIGQHDVTYYDNYEIIDGDKKYYRLTGRIAEKFFETNDELYKTIIEEDDIVIIINLVYRVWEVLKNRDFLKETLIGKLLDYNGRYSKCTNNACIDI